LPGSKKTRGVCHLVFSIFPDGVDDLKRFGSTILVLALVGFVGACGSGKSDKPATQMAARVNSDEITVHQVNAVLTRATGLTEANVALVKKEILERLIDQQLAVQQAEERQLDRTPAVVQAIDAARREILARAYLEQVAGARARPAAEEVKRYYVEHPELFAQRRVYNLREMLVPADAVLADEIKRWVAQGKSMTEMANALKTRQLRIAANAAVLPAEQLPLDTVARFHAMKDGETIVVESPRGLTVAHLVSSQTSPIDEAAALARVEQFLTLRGNAEVATAEIKALREKARIDRMGEFAPGGAAVVAPVVNLDKGVAGLK
jgi:EpsD family peptidyl-prolyl cis-trans isomerase